MTIKQLIEKYGNPMLDKKTFELHHLVNWDIPDTINEIIKPLPNRILINKDMIVPLEKVFNELIKTELYKEIKTYDGCYNVRYQRGSNVISRHAFAMAIDFNATWNPFVRVAKGADRNEVRKRNVKFTEDFLDVWRGNGFQCGADWITVIDGMHFQL